MKASKSRNYEQDILDCLSTNSYGLTVTDISKKIVVSRNTAYRYLERLEGQHLVYNKRVGTYNLYFSKERSLLLKDVIISFFKGLLANLKVAFPNKEGLFMEFGKKIADYVMIPFSDEDKEFLETLKDQSEMSILESIESLFPYFNILNDDIGISDIKINKNSKMAIITFANSNMLETTDDYIYYFFLIAGFMEEKLSQYTGKNIRFEILDYEIFDKKESSFIKISFDFQVLLPQMTTEETEELIVPDSDVIDVELIKMTISPLTLIFIIRSILFNKKALILVEKDFLRSDFLNFLKFLFQDAFEIDISVEKSEVYKRNKNFFKNHIVIGTNEVLSKGHGFLNPKKVNVEKVIVQNFFAEYNLKSSLIKLKKEINKVFILSQELAKIIENFKRENHVKERDSKEIFSRLEKTHNTKLSLPYLTFLVEVVENYFKIEVPDVLKFFLYRL